MKQCSECGLSCSGRQRYCGKKCRRKAEWKRIKAQGGRTGNGKNVIEWRRNCKRRAVSMLGGKCVICGYDRSMRALGFHHVDGSGKDFTISASTRSWASIAAEIRKCILVCANCHAEIHEGIVDARPYFSGEAQTVERLAINQTEAGSTPAAGASSYKYWRSANGKAGMQCASGLGETSAASR